MTSVYNLEYDSGIHDNSFNYVWPIKNPILSGKDKELINLKNI
jgi:dTDP-4-dehydrorhamnose 3,5-epimerase-like enzyme